MPFPAPTGWIGAAATAGGPGFTERPTYVAVWMASFPRAALLGTNKRNV